MRNASLQDLVALLNDQNGRKVDVVAPASKLRSVNGIIRVEGAEQMITLDGVTQVDGNYLPTAVLDGHLADRLGIPVRYIRKMREERIDLFDANVNGWLHGIDGIDGDPRKFFFRGFKGDDGVGVGRALMSDTYGVLDNFDVLTATLAGIRESGVAVEINRCDLTDRNMYVKVSAPGVAALAPELLKGYRSPYSGNTGDQNPTVFAGFVIRNSEVGEGAATITPEITVEICTNGLTLTKEAFRKVHLGSRMEEGIRWSKDTQEKDLAVITAKARDAVATFLDVDYVKAQIAKLEAKAGVPVVDAQATVTNVCKAVGYSEDFTKSVLDFFITGGQLTAGGVMQAVTAAVQKVDDADVAWDISSKAVEAMELVAAGR